jgi:hypothetical protein
VGRAGELEVIFGSAVQSAPLPPLAAATGSAGGLCGNVRAAIRGGTRSRADSGPASFETRGDVSLIFFHPIPSLHPARARDAARPPTSESWLPVPDLVVPPEELWELRASDRFEAANQVGRLDTAPVEVVLHDIHIHAFFD